MAGYFNIIYLSRYLQDKEHPMTHPAPNDIVTIAFTGKLDNGEIFITMTEQEPLQAKIGDSNLPPSVEQALVEMTVGEQRKVRVPPEEGYGPRQKILVQTLDNQELIDSLKPKPGMVLSLKVDDKDGVEQKVPATVISIEGSEITVDYNHPLAGHHLTYDLTLLAIQKAAG